MAPSTLSLFLTALMFAGAKAADKELSEACTSSDACVHPTLELACDDITSTCRIKNGKACDGAGHGGLCVSGATCASGVCACEGTTYTVNSNGKCNLPANLWGGACVYSSTNAEGDCTPSSGLACPSGATKCECAADFDVALASGKCTVVIAADKVGKTCASTADCGTGTNLICQSLKCVCDAGYTGSTGGDCTAIAASKVGKLCTAGTVATDCGAQATTNLECGTTPAVCKCASNYYGVPAGDCLAAAGKLNGGCSGTGKGTCADSDVLCTGTAKSCKSDLGGACTMTSDCADANAVCDEFAKTCLLKTDQTCNTPAAKMDKCVSGASCETTGTSPSNQCKCIDTVYTEDTTNKICNAAEGKATGACKSTDPKCDDANAECVATNSKCTCKTGYKLKNADATCEKSGAITVIASALTVMLVSVSGHLITLH